jgi:hypothetical protein
MYTIYITRADGIRRQVCRLSSKDKAVDLAHRLLDTAPKGFPIVVEVCRGSFQLMVAA